MADTDTPIRYSMSRVNCDWMCPRRRFWQYVFGGRGIVPKRQPLALEFGSIIHEAYAALLQGASVDAAALEGVASLNELLAAESIEEMVGATQQRVMEMRYLTEGLIRLLGRAVVPKLLEFYRPVRVEKKVTYQHDGCELVSVPDALLERHQDEALIYTELKTASSIDERWARQWWRAVQLPAGVLGVAETLGKPLAATIVIGLSKGYWSRQYERQESPLLYGYRDGERIVAKYRNGLRKVGIWEGGISSKEWVDSLPEEIIEKQVTTVGPIPFQAPLTAAWLRQTAIREHAIDAARRQLFGGQPLREVEARRILDEVFPQRFKECESSWGSKCGYIDACFIPSVERAPLESGLFEWRPESPHEAEAVMMPEEEEAA